MLDTLSYAKKLKAAGFSDAQAEAQAEALASAMESGVVTKPDIASLKVDLNALGTELKADLNALKTELRGEANEFRAHVEGKFALLQWMIAFNLVMTVTLLFKVFSA